MNKKIISNVIHLYTITIIKIMVPFIIMPYLARVLAEEQYAVYSYMRGITTFVNLAVDYGFIYSATSKVACYSKSRTKIQSIIQNVTGAKAVLSIVSLIISMGVVVTNKITRNYMDYAMLTILSICILNLLPDYVFRGLECMGVLSKRMILSKTVTTGLLFILVHSENDFIVVAELEMLNAIISLVITAHWLIKRKYFIYVKFNLHEIWYELKDGFDYFVFTIAPSMYGALNTIVIGNCLNAREIVYWSTSWNVVSAIMTAYLPISNAIFPSIIKSRNYSGIKKLMKFILPLLVIGSGIVGTLSKMIFTILVGKNYSDGYYTLILLLPVVVFAFPSILLGAPVLGAAGQNGKLRTTTIITAVFHLLGLLILYISGEISLKAVCVLRCITEFVGMMLRFRATRDIF